MTLENLIEFFDCSCGFDIDKNDVKEISDSLNLVKTELESTRKALELACEDLSTVKRCAIRLCKTDTAICLEYDTCHDKYKLADKYIQKARKEEC